MEMTIEMTVRKVIALVSVLSLAPLMGGCLSSSGSASGPTAAAGKSQSYEERQKCQDTSEGGEGKRVCY